jgi:hypothetical protein
MTADALFRITNLLAMIGWIGLLLTPLWPVRLRDRLPRLIFAIGIPALIAALYTALIFVHWAGHPGGFNSLDGVMALFTDRWLVLAGWVHYLAFDLFLGGWELADSRQRGVPYLAVAPMLLLTFFFGPMGFLGYLGIRTIFQKRSATVTT